jgi:YD repeat-containing protein
LQFLAKLSIFILQNPTLVKVNIHTIAFLFTLCFLYTSCKKDEIEHKGLLTEILYVDSQWKMELKYNPDGKLISTLANGGDTLFYNNQGQVIKYTDGNVTYSFEYATNGQIIKRIPILTVIANYHPDTVEYRYDAKGRIIQCISTFNDQNNIPRQGWIRNYSYNSLNDIIAYRAIHPYYNQTEEETLSYYEGENPLKLSNSILFFLNEHFYEALNQHNPKRKDRNDFISIYLYDYSSGTMPELQTIKFYSPNQPVSPASYKSMRQVKFTYK